MVAIYKALLPDISEDFLSQHVDKNKDLLIKAISAHYPDESNKFKAFLQSAQHYVSGLPDGNPLQTYKIPNKRDNIRKFRIVLLWITVGAIVIGGLLGFSGHFPVYAYSGGPQLSGGNGALAAAFSMFLIIVIFVDVPLIGILGFIEMVIRSLLAFKDIASLADYKGKNKNKTVAQLIRPIAGKLTVWVGTPLFVAFLVYWVGFLPAFVQVQFAQLLIAHVTDFIVNKLFNASSKDEKKNKTNLFYLYALVDVAVAGGDGSLSFLHSWFPTIQQAWVSGWIGTGAVVVISVFLTGFWSLFHTKKQ